MNLLGLQQLRVSKAVGLYPFFSLFLKNGGKGRLSSLKLACVRRIFGRPQSAEDPERAESNECDPCSSINKIHDADLFCFALFIGLINAHLNLELV